MWRRRGSIPTQTEKGEQMKVSPRDLRGSEPVNWNAIDWPKAQRNVRQLQVRIAKAEREGRPGKVRALQRILTHSFSGRAMAVKRVTSNTGKRTPGVDGELWTTTRHKSAAIERLKPTRYHAQPLRRVYIPKSNGKRRPLGIPTMFDRAMQALHLLGLDPVAECRADSTSYGFRKYRSTADAIEHSFKALRGPQCASWVLEGDIMGCFDHISHPWLLAHIPMDTRILRQWLKAGYLEANAFVSTEEGTPQGGIISPTLANLTLDGIERELSVRYKRPQKEGGWENRCGKRNRKITFVRYADDFIITGVSRELLEDEVTPLIRDFLTERGLTLSEEKTRVTHIEDGLDFLGMTLRRWDGKLIIQPSKKSIASLLMKVRTLIRRHQSVAACTLIRLLNPVLRGWANYYRHVCSKRIFAKIDHALWEALKRWAYRRHPKKPRRWIIQKYFCTLGARHWVFHGTGRDGKRVYLLSMGKTPIERHVKIRRDANPYDRAWDAYLAKRASGIGTTLAASCCTFRA